ncbi:MAG: GNAT family N-acetyltransferase [Calditrichaeota bacterium]|nr:GNAT family N-acetyltransferase [Deltaproteobacteria bacterium]MBT7616553.1 GNAT family N-acetyltransferase [Calditrichota bacterium]MBT4266784.1 GNAT family N-acetyltransferase [Deltaproteobacteria bacterium]MBT4643748.1 GNAT family N-acetyltransferase [Deltaproteobacteria bacterium]MBT7151992.1 GNAT family N-acetyltransferase [Deltaproteobacteria bacterium]
MEKSDIEESARVLSIAMLDNPIHLVVFQNSDERIRIQIENDFTNLLKDRPGIVFIAKEKQNIIGVMRMFSCSGKDTADDETKSQDENSIDWRRKVWMNEWGRHDPKDQHWHLGPIGVLPSHQGSGVGSMLMNRFCLEVDACRASAFLETDKNINVVFYEKFGFKTIAESMIFGVKSPYMQRVST